MTDSGDILSTRRPTSPSEEARYWRKRAAEVRKVGEMFGDPESRSKLNQIASHYDQMADELEASSKINSYAFDAGYASDRR